MGNRGLSGIRIALIFGNMVQYWSDIGIIKNSLFCYIVPALLDVHAQGTSFLLDLQLILFIVQQVLLDVLKFF